MTTWWCSLVLFCAILNIVYTQSASKVTKSDQTDLAPSWRTPRTWFQTPSTWSLDFKIPMTEEYDDYARRKKFKVKKRLKQLVVPLLIAYKLKFFTLIPIIVGGLLLLVGATGMAGFFFALFAASMGLKTGSYH